MSKPILALPQDQGMYVLDTHASDFGLGAVLSQQQPDGEKVIAYSSRTLDKREQKYETTRKELLAVVNGLKKFRQYLLGRHFVIRTDHAALTWLRRSTEPMPQLAHWLTYIEQYDYTIEHRPGTKHGNADGLSRRSPVDLPDTANVRIISQPITDLSAPNEEGNPSTATEELQKEQKEDLEIGATIRLRLADPQRPCADDLQAESEETKRLCAHWSELEIHNGLVYRRNGVRKKEKWIDCNC